MGPIEAARPRSRSHHRGRRHARPRSPRRRELLLGERPTRSRQHARCAESVSARRTLRILVDAARPRWHDVQPERHRPVAWVAAASFRPTTASVLASSWCASKLSAASSRARSNCVTAAARSPSLTLARPTPRAKVDACTFAFFSFSRPASSNAAVAPASSPPCWRSCPTLT